jgi:predicted permease
MTTVALWIVRLVTPRANREWVVGDTVEQFNLRARSSGTKAANQWLLRETVRIVLAAPRHHLAIRPRDAARSTVRQGAGQMWSSWLQDIRYGLRLLRRSPVFTLVAVASLALGIGGSAAVFSVLNAVVLRNLPIAEPDHFFSAVRQQRRETSTRFSWPSVQGIREELAGKAEIAAASSVGTMQLRLEGVGDGVAGERGSVQLVSGEYFEILRQRPLLGRLLTPADNQTLGAHPVAVISHGYWRRQLGGAPDAVGRTLTINGTTFAIVGVTRPEFFGTNVAIRNADAWIPLMMQAAVRYASNSSSHGNADSRQPWPPQPLVEWLTLFVRVPAGTEPSTIAAAITVRHQADGAARRADDATYADQRAAERVTLDEAGRGLSSLRASSSTTLYVLLAMMTVLLLIASGNVAGLLVARAAAREREIAVRLSLGAGRLRLARQLIVESCLLGVAGGLLGLGVALWGRNLIVALFAGGANPVVTLDTGLDWRVLAFAVAITAVTSVACGLLPAIRGTRGRAAESLTLQSRSALEGRRRLFAGRALVGVQIAFCLLLLVVAGLFVRSLRILTTTDIGFDREQVLGARLDVRSLGYSAEERHLLYQRILDRAQTLPGVVSASMSLNGPVTSSAWLSGFVVDGYTPQPGERMQTSEELVTEQYFSTVGLRIVRGRGFGPLDRGADARSTIINETMARRYFAGQDPIGKRWGYSESALRGPGAFTIVGVVEDARYRDLKGTVPTMAYHLSGPSVDESDPLNDLEIRTSGSALALAGTLRQVLAQVEPRMPVNDVLSLEQRVGRLVWQESIVARLTAIFSGISLLLACLGLYGTISYGVSQRVPELGLRLALGADRRQVLWLVMREALTLVIFGSTVGLLLAYGAARSLGSQLYGVGPLDPVAYVAGATLLVTVGLGAAYLPALRASRIEPMTAIARN